MTERADTVEVTYQGPGSAYRIPDFLGTEYVLPRGVVTPVPSKLATRLKKVKGQRFETPEPAKPKTDSKTDGRPERVNAE